MPTIYCYFENKAAAACTTSTLNIFCSICTAFRCLHRIWDRPNFAENAIRPFVQGRKAWLFCDTPKGADSSAIVYSMVETAKANGLDPYTYLKLLLTELPYLGKNPASDKLDLFMPWTAAIRKNCILPTKKISPEDL